MSVDIYGYMDVWERVCLTVCIHSHAILANCSLACACTILDGISLIYTRISRSCTGCQPTRLASEVATLGTRTVPSGRKRRKTKFGDKGALSGYDVRQCQLVNDNGGSPFSG